MRRKSFVVFALARLFRIFPALAVAVTLCAILLGPLTTSLTLHEYLLHPDFSHYFRNIVLDMHYQLPGVFSNNASSAVNGSLWTLEFEVTMYIALSIFLSIVAHTSRFFAPSLLVLLICLNLTLITSPAQGFHVFYYIYLGQFFMVGVAAYIYRDRIRISTPLAMLCLIIVLSSAILGGFFFCRLIAGSYFLLWLAYAAPKVRDPFTRSGDFSYGMYIYAFPIQQLMAESLPWGRSWQGNIASSLPLTFFAAYLSWRFIELPSGRVRESIVAWCYQLRAHAEQLQLR